jgi:hypothetical protein
MGLGLAFGPGFNFVACQLKRGHDLLLAKMHLMDSFSTPAGRASNCLFR